MNGYKQIGERWVADFRATMATADWPVATQQAAIAAFARFLADSPLRDTPLSALSDLVLENLACFAATPTREEALAYGAFRDAEDQNDSYHHALAAPYSRSRPAGAAPAGWLSSQRVEGREAFGSATR